MTSQIQWKEAPAISCTPSHSTSTSSSPSLTTMASSSLRYRPPDRACLNMAIWWETVDHLLYPHRLDLLVFSLTKRSSHPSTTPLNMSSNVSFVTCFSFLRHHVFICKKIHGIRPPWLRLNLYLCCRCSSLHCSCSIICRHLGLGHGICTVMNSFHVPVSFSVN